MSELKTPIRSVLDSGYDEADVQRLWRGIQARSAARGARSSARWAWGGTGFALAALAIAALVWVRRPFVGPLELAASTGPVRALLAGARIDHPIDFADGSHIRPNAGAELEVLANDGAAFITVLRDGKSAFDVHPGGPRRWVIECGLGTIEVVGTEFTLERAPSRLEVVVERGTVLVRGERVPGRTRRVAAGERLVVGTAEAETAASVESPGPESTAPALEPSPALSAKGVAHSAATPSEASAAPSRAESPGANLEALMARADSARRVGDLATAIDLLERGVREGGSDPRAAVAALALARLTRSSAPERAARALSAVLRAGCPRGLEEDVLARLVEASARSGDNAGARRAAERYAERFPGGARSEEVRRWAPVD